ncbi:MAG TPA: class I SAM-dependent methyltransferase [Vicinamibacterales bacterium]|nr:class I SAM-dependent methyltransferase [Vicinamibacterales bacterium]
MSSTEFSEKTCSAPAERSARMRDVVLKYIPRDRATGVLDLGCGTGSLVFLLADAVASARIVGVDISAANIRAAEERRAAMDPATAGRIVFEQADYLARTATPVDVLVTDGVLHLIPGDTNELFAKLAADVRAGGFLIAAMPYDCGYNYAFAMLRRALRVVRSGALDALILRAGRLLHGREMDDEALRERIPYMYIAPQRLAGRRLREAIAPSVGLRLVARHPMPSVSLSQLRHEVLVFEKAA